MTPPDLCRAPATELSAAIRAKQLSPVEIVEAVLARIESVNPAINAYLDVDGDRALDAARAAEAAVMRGDELGLLHGLPVPIKDLEPSEGLRHTSGSILQKDQIAEFDGAVTGRVKAAGGIIIGKTNTPHLGHKDMCDNLLGPPGRNPWNTDRTPGGSSGGAAAAVAAGLGPLAHGSDGAGSIRIPAALCGVFGFKPSFGRLPYWPNLDIWSARSHNGPISRTVADAALFTQATAGPDPRDPTAIANLPDDYLAAVADPLPALRGLRIALSAQTSAMPPSTPTCAAWQARPPSASPTLAATSKQSILAGITPGLVPRFAGSSLWPPALARPTTKVQRPSNRASPR